MSRKRVWSALAVLVAVVAVITAASFVVRTSSPGSAAQLREGSTAVVDGPERADGVLVSRTLFGRSDEAIVVTPGADAQSWDRARALAEEHQTPVFALDDADRAEVAEEMGRLGVSTIYVVGDTSAAGGLGDARTTPDTRAMSGQRAPQTGSSIAYLSEAARPDAEATAHAAGARVVRVPADDPRGTGESVRVLREQPTAAVRAFGSGFGSSDEFADRVHTARTQPELPGGGQVVFPGRQIVALYGSPGSPTLGPLGAQDIPASIDRVKKLAAEYQPYSRVPVVPAFEIIVTVASSEPGPDNSYSSMVDPARIRPWVDAARAAGVYVTLDLQPGRTDFLTQARRYADLLAQPHVGLALDPEWRLKPDQVHLTQIGSVSADEVNRTSQWLAGFTAERGLPQKVFVLHEFDSAMLANRERIDTSHPELQVLIHADGHGEPPVKMGTWQRLVTDLPPNVWMGWKNFYTEDHPTFTPSQTLQVRPHPVFVSYQ
ncbi:hypothetical protein EEB19_16300 [Gordonia sp. OPL2]|nr:hypothetical protein EEB19_16300 [Gordonia sp. OPL2]